MPRPGAQNQDGATRIVKDLPPDRSPRSYGVASISLRHFVEKLGRLRRQLVRVGDKLVVRAGELGAVGVGTTFVGTLVNSLTRVSLSCQFTPFRVFPDRLNRSGQFRPELLKLDVARGGF